LNILGHYLLWSYRFDIFIITIVIILVVSLLAGTVITRENDYKLLIFENNTLFETFKASRTKARELYTKLIESSDLPDDARERLKAEWLNLPIVFPNPESEPETIHDIGLLRLRFDIEVPGDVGDKLTSLAAAEQSWHEKLEAIILLTSLPWGLSCWLLSGVMSIYFTNFMYDVFYFHGREYVTRHPHFAVVFAQISLIAILPFVASAAIDNFCLDRIKHVQSTLRSGGDQPIYRVFQGNSSVDEVGQFFFTADNKTRSDGKGDLFWSPALVLLLPFSSWVSVWVCLGRRLRETLFFMGNVIAIIVLVAIITAGRNWGFDFDFEIRLIPADVYVTLTRG
jgi:hypothetical protein